MDYLNLASKSIWPNACRRQSSEKKFNTWTLDSHKAEESKKMKKKKKDSSDRVKSERKNTQNNTHKLRRFVKCINVFFFLFDRVYWRWTFLMLNNTTRSLILWAKNQNRGEQKRGDTDTRLIYFQFKYHPSRFLRVTLNGTSWCDI